MGKEQHTPHSQSMEQSEDNLLTCRATRMVSLLRSCDRTIRLLLKLKSFLELEGSKGLLLGILIGYSMLLLLGVGWLGLILLILLQCFGMHQVT